MNICFFGVGGVGGYFGALVARQFNTLHNIYFIARGAHMDAINGNGLILKKSGGEEVIKVRPAMCTDSVSELPVCDIIILSVKAYDLDNAAQALSSITGEKTIILPLLNGVDIYERIRRNLSTGIVLPSCVYVGTHIENPGVIYQKGGSCRISLGPDPQHGDVYPRSLLEILQDSGIDFSWEENVYTSIWTKFIFIAAYGLVTAAYDKTLGELLEDPDLSAATKAIMAEIQAIAAKLNIALAGDIVDKSFQKGHEFPSETKTSFQRDVESKGRINEGDLFGGTVIRYGEKLNIATPSTKEIYTLLQKKFK